MEILIFIILIFAVKAGRFMLILTSGLNVRGHVLIYFKNRTAFSF